MHPSPRSLGGIIRRGLAVCAVLGQLLGTIGIVPVQADSRTVSSTPYPCQKFPCGCRTAEQCWSGPCCCFTMREKVAWAAERGIDPPQHAVQLALDESRVDESEVADGSDPQGDCCTKSKQNKSTHNENRVNQSTEPTAICCSEERNSTVSGFEHNEHQSKKRESKDRGKPADVQRGVGWMAGLFAQKCRGPGFNEMGFLNIGIPPAPTMAWICDRVLLERCDTPNQIAICTAVRPVIPPPKS
jgi:hypothetical protein